MLWFSRASRWSMLTGLFSCARGAGPEGTASPARGCSPGRMERVQGAAPIEFLARLHVRKMPLDGDAKVPPHGLRRLVRLLVEPPGVQGKYPRIRPDVRHHRDEDDILPAEARREGDARLIFRQHPSENVFRRPP